MNWGRQRSRPKSSAYRVREPTAEKRLEAAAFSWDYIDDDPLPPGRFGIRTCNSNIDWQDIRIGRIRETD